MIDYDGPVPRYVQLAELIRDRIRAGQYLPDRRIPSEPDLSSETGLARETVRRGLRLLVDEGTLVRVPGKGTYVSPDPPV